MAESQEQEIRVSAGEQLKHLREQKNLSVQEVATRLNLEARIIEAIESSNFEALPAAAYVRGYLRSYAKILGVTPEAFVTAYNDGAPEPPEIIPEVRHATQTSSSDKPVRAFSYLVTLTLVILLVAWLYSNFVVDKQSFLNIGGEERVEESVPGLDYEFPVIEHSTLPFYKHIEVQEDTDGEDSETIPVNIDTGDSEKVADGEEQLPATVTTDNEGPDSLVLHMKNDSWVEVFDSEGNKVFVNLGHQGQTLYLKGTAPFKVLLGFAEGVSLEFNGEAFDTQPYTNGSIARFSLGR